MIRETTYFYCTLGALIGAYFIWYPSSIFSIDELSYLSRALALSQGKIDYIQSTVIGSPFSWASWKYPLGTSTVLSIPSIFDPSLLFMTGIIYLFVSLVVIRNFLLFRNIYTDFTIWIVICYLPLLFFVRSLMSEMPSLFLVSVFCWILFTERRQLLYYFLMGCIIGISIWFRETNGLLLGLLLLPELKKINIKNFGGIAIGFTLGLLPRLLSAAWVYGDAFYTINYPGFSICHLINNIPLYSTILFVLLPGGLYFLLSYHGKYRIHIVISLSAYILLYAMYSYNATEYSGWLTGIFYNGRYFIPTLPLWAMIYAWHIRKWQFINRGRIKILGMMSIVVYIVGMNVVHHKIGNEHRSIAQNIYKELDNSEIVIYSNSAYRLLNPMYGTLNKCIHIDNIGQADLSGTTEDFLFIQSSKTNTQAQRKVSATEISRLTEVLSSYARTLESHEILFDGTEVSIWRYVKVYDS